MTYDLDRFIIAQKRDYTTALEELHVGHKRSHWMWYVFPQIAGLGLVQVVCPPKSNSEFWQKKFSYNVERDERNYQKLRELGWHVIIVWECEIRHGDKTAAMIALEEKIKCYREI